MLLSFVNFVSNPCHFAFSSPPRSPLSFHSLFSSHRYQMVSLIRFLPPFNASRLFPRAGCRSSSHLVPPSPLTVNNNLTALLSTFHSIFPFLLPHYYPLSDLPFLSFSTPLLSFLYSFPSVNSQLLLSFRSPLQPLVMQYMYFPGS